MRVSYIQTALQWEQKPTNLQHFEGLLGSLAGHTDLVVLPEMFTTGFSMNAATLAETPDGPTFVWMQQQAKRLDAAITGSFICVENGQFFNRLLWMQPDGQFHHYNKKHLFSLAGEHQTYTAGEQVLAIDYMGWRIRPLICYDLRFPVWARQPIDPALRYDLLLYMANWPQPRVHHWKSLLVARAIENQAYTVGVNIIGTDGNGLAYSGDSVVVDYSGQVLATSAFSQQVVTLELHREQLLKYREQFPFLNDADPFRIG